MTTTTTNTGPTRGTTPALPVPEADAFPEPLTRAANWVGYGVEPRGERLEKIPKNPHTGGNASTAARATWADFATARAFCLRHGYGLGFMLAPPFVGIDLDHCRDAATGELSTLGVAVLSNLDTYAEVSISGTGVKAIAYGEKPGTRCRKNGLEVEIYSEKRLFALTGQRLAGAPLLINDCQDYVGYLYTTVFGQPDPAPSAPRPTFTPTDDDRAVIDWLATYDSKFPALWAGDTSAYNGDDSAADLALCSRLAFRTGDENRVDSLFRQSNLYRDKWERGDYRHGTIKRAMNQRRFFTPTSPTPSSVEPPPQSDDPQPPWEDTPPAPDLALLRQENARLRAELAAEREYRAAVHAVITNKQQTPVERVIAYGLTFAVQNAADLGKTSAADPAARPVNCTAIGGLVGLTTQTVSANIGRFDQRGQLRKVVSMKATRDGKPYPEIAVCLPGDTVLDKLRTVATWQRPEGTKHVGGNGKRCSECGSENTHREVRIVCDDCGHVSKPLVAPAPVATEDTRGESWGSIMGVAPTPSTVEGVAYPEAEATPAPNLATVGANADPSPDETNNNVEGLRSISGTPQANSQPPPVAAWSGTHPCSDCGRTCVASAGTVPRCLPCQRARDDGGDVAAGGG